MTDQQEDKPRLLRIRQVLEVVPVSRSTIWEWVKKGHFPKPMRIGARTTVWDEEEVNDFIKRHKAA